MDLARKYKDSRENYLKRKNSSKRNGRFMGFDFVSGDRLNKMEQHQRDLDLIEKENKGDLAVQNRSEIGSTNRTKMLEAGRNNRAETTADLNDRKLDLKKREEDRRFTFDKKTTNRQLDLNEKDFNRKKFQDMMDRDHTNEKFDFLKDKFDFNKKTATQEQKLKLFETLFPQREGSLMPEEGKDGSSEYDRMSKWKTFKELSGKGADKYRQAAALSRLLD